jgi:hypothetical protein
LKGEKILLQSNEITLQPGSTIVLSGGGYGAEQVVSSTNKTDRNNITEILLKVALNTINPIPILKSLVQIPNSRTTCMTLAK